MWRCETVWLARRIQPFRKNKKICVHMGQFRFQDKFKEMFAQSKILHYLKPDDS
jgi:hypothetical protein